MKKPPHKLPCELHDPKPEVPRWEQPLDLSDRAPEPTQSVLPRPDRPPEISG